MLRSSTNEKLDRSNFIEGVRCLHFFTGYLIQAEYFTQTKLLGTYLYEVGLIAT